MSFDTHLSARQSLGAHMVIRNTRFLSALPVPIVSIASYQLTGRGRGTNGWTSPFGCLQFSILYRISGSSFPTSKIVFVQYLFALAVVEACRDESVLGKHGDRIRLKWPNDIYAIVGPGEGEKTKIGGVLVNTSFSGGRIEILIGQYHIIRHAHPARMCTRLWCECPQPTTVYLAVSTSFSGSKS